MGPGTVHPATIATLGLGTAERSAVPVLVVERRFPNAELVLGTDVLSQQRILLDLSERPYLVLDPDA